MGDFLKKGGVVTKCDDGKTTGDVTKCEVGVQQAVIQGKVTYKLYTRLRDSYTEAHKDITKEKAHTQANIIWNRIKHDPIAVERKIEELKQEKIRKRRTVDQYFLQLSKKVPKASATITSEQNNVPEKDPETSVLDKCSGTSVSEKETSVSVPDKASEKRPTPAQNDTKKLISVLQSECLSMQKKIDSGLSPNPDLLRKLLKIKRAELQDAEKRLKTLQGNIVRQAKAREKKKRQFEEAVEKCPEILQPTRPKAGRPRLEEEQPGLMEAIVDLASIGGGADFKRRSEMIRACKTLDDLTERLNEAGFTISRSATYIRLLPRRGDTAEGKRHVTTVPVKLVAAQSVEHSKHVDSGFAAATIVYINGVASVLGPDQVLYVSQDDKARVPIGITAANKQAPLLMSMEYRVTLPDHDFVVGARHSLIPSVYAVLRVKSEHIGKEEAVTYSGPTYISIRSGKHDSSTAFTHGDDFNRLVNLPEMSGEVFAEDGQVKPVLVISSDGGPDENPRYPKTLQVAAEKFKMYNFDAVFVVTNAPGRSAYNPVERRMAPLSKDLSGIVLPHEHYGSHLNSAGKTVDLDLEKRNFQKAGEVLAEIWSNTKIDGHATVAEFTTSKEPPQLDALTEEWKAIHVRQSQYLMQIIKCDDKACCGVWRSSLRMLLRDRFLPAPVPCIQSRYFH